VIDQWVEELTVDPIQSKVDLANKGKATKVIIEPVEIAVGDYAAPCLVTFARPITDEEKAALKSQILALAPGLIVDLQLGREEEPARIGVKAAEPIEGYVWTAYCSMHLRLEEVKAEEPE